MGTIVIDEQFDKCRRMLKDDISRKRYIHSLGVSDTAACLAMRYGFDIRISALAGLLHDCAKGLDDKEMLAMARKGGLEISEIELANPELLHSKAGSVLAKEKYGIEDEDILGSICWHTTGRPGMSMLEKIIFLADYIEPNRANIPWINDIRQKAFTDIDEAVALACKNSIDYLQRSSRTVDRITIDTYEYYKDHLK